MKGVERVRVCTRLMSAAREVSAHVDAVVEPISERAKDEVARRRKPIPAGVVGIGVPFDRLEGRGHFSDADRPALWCQEKARIRRKPVHARGNFQGRSSARRTGKSLVASRRQRHAE